MMKYIFTIYITSAPLWVSAQTGASGEPEVSDFASLLDFILFMLNGLVYLAVGAAMMAFVFGLTRYMLSMGDSDTQKKAQSLMVWGVVAIFVMTSIWGLVAFARQVLNFDSEQVPERPWVDYNSVNL